MAVDRIQAFQGENQTNIHDQEIDLIMQEVNKGVDVKGIAPKAITADKMRIFSGGISSPYINFDTLAAGTWSNPGYLTIGSDVNGGGIGEGRTHYIHSAYFDVYVDGLTSPAPYDSHLVRGSVFVGSGGGGLDGRDRFVLKAYPTIGATPLVTIGANTFMTYIVMIKNDDTVSHSYNVNFFINIIATQVSGGG